MKKLAWGTIIILNIFFVQYMMTMGLSRPRDFQLSFVTVCMVQLAFEIVVFETLEVVWVQYLIPRLILSDVRNKVNVLRRQINKVYDMKTPGFGNPLNSADYLFTSVRLAKEFPSVFEI